MSQISTAKSALSAIPLEDDAEQPVREAQTDQLVQTNRAVTPKAALDKRATPRLSIAELNSLDMDQLKERLAKVSGDTRPPVEKVIDLIDLPRNTIANIAFGKPTAEGVAGLIGGPAAAGAALGSFGGPIGAGAGALVGAGLGAAGALVGLAGRALSSEGYRKDVQATSDGEAAAGQPRIMASDALRAAGVKNRVVNGVLGFAGDVALDPLTYVGPAGWGAKLTANSGRSVLLRGGAARSLKRAIADTAAGAAVREADSVAGRYLAAKGLAKTEGETVAQAVDRMNREVFGTPTGRLNRVFSTLGGDRIAKGGSLVDDFHRGVVDPAAQAARDLVAHGGQGTGPGLRIGLKPGEIGSEVLHVPFTDYTVQIPAFTASANVANDAAMLAKLRDIGDGGRVLANAETAGSFVAARTIGEIQNQIRAVADEASLRSVEMAHLVNAGQEVDPIKQVLHDDLARLTEQAQALAEQSARSMPDPSTASANIRTAQDALAQAEAVRAAHEAVREAATQTDRLQYAAQLGLHNIDPATAIEHIGEETYRFAIENPEAAVALADTAQARLTALRNYADTVKAPLEALLSSDDRMLVEWGKRLLNTDHTAMAVSVFGAMGDSLKYEWNVAPDNRVVKMLSDLDRRWRGTFGARGGHLAYELARAQGVATGAEDTAVKESTLLRGRVSKALEDAGVQIDKNTLDEAMQYIYHRQFEAVDPESTFYHWWEMGPNGPKIGQDGKLTNPSALKQRLEQARADGLLTDPKVRAVLDATADDINRLNKELGLAETQDRILNSRIGGYVPHVFTPEASKAAEEQAQRFRDFGGAGGGIHQGYTKQRTTWQTRFQRADGTWDRFFEVERGLLSLDDEAIAKFYPDSAAEKIKIRDTIAEYDKLAADKAFADKFQPRATDPIELNQLAKEGRFDRLFGGANLEQVWQTNAASVLEGRLASHERAVARRILLDTVNQNSLKIDPDTVKKVAAAGGREVQLTNSTKAYIDTEASTRLGGKALSVKLGAERFRTLDNSLRDRFAGDILGLEAKDIDGLLLHERLADRIEDTAKLFDPATMQSLLQGLDTMTGIWKMLTLSHPSWPIFNLVGNSWLAISGGARPDHLFDPRRWRDMLRMMMARTPEELHDLEVVMGGIRMRGDEAASLLRENKIINNNLSLESAGQFVRRNPGLLNKPDAFLRNHLGPWFKMSQSADDMLRGLAFWSFMDQGHTFNAARAQVLDSMFDFSDFTEIERSVFRRLAPFYSWARSNLGYQMKLLLERPVYAATAPKLKQALEDAVSGEQAIPDEARPGWMRDAMAAQIGRDPQNRFGLLFGNGVLPVTDIYNIMLPIVGAEGALKFMHYFVSMLNPAVATPLQLGAGTEFFTGKTIGAQTGADLSPTEFIGNQFRPLAEYGPGGRVARSFQQGGAVQGLTRAFLGGRIQSMDQQRVEASREREFRDQETLLRSAVRRSERMGQSSVQPRAELLKLYERMARAGFKIPAWAEDQLAQLAPNG